MHQQRISCNQYISNRMKSLLFILNLQMSHRQGVLGVFCTYWVRAGSGEKKRDLTKLREYLISANTSVSGQNEAGGENRFTGCTLTTEWKCLFLFSKRITCSLGHMWLHSLCFLGVWRSQFVLHVLSMFKWSLYTRASFSTIRCDSFLFICKVAFNIYYVCGSVKMSRWWHSITRNMSLIF